MKAFLYDIESEYELENEELKLDEILTEFYQLSEQEGSFIGIKTETEPIQFAYETQDKWLVDVPYDIKNRLTLQKYASYDECVEIIKQVYSGFSPTKIEGLKKVSI
ncbi:hypothetical protein [Cellulophaga baltica]|uniref:hypothetical protein n=1 Tax=Cellulophaga baltica TaxID=76594 RepID=UPI00040E0988|nr:hypothetical protein [Cellulophaga baltica]AIY14023.1 hypothetical protein M667_12880 [Cellulophaga baltica NN016038]